MKGKREFLVTIDPGDLVNSEDIVELVREVTTSVVTVVEVKIRQTVVRELKEITEQPSEEPS